MKECLPEEILGWKAAWRRVGKVGQRLVAAMGKISEDVQMDEKAQPWDWEEELPPVRYPLSAGTFIWNPRAGLACHANSRRRARFPSRSSCGNETTTPGSSWRRADGECGPRVPRCRY